MKRYFLLSALTGLINVSCYSYQSTKDSAFFEPGKSYKITNTDGVKIKINVAKIRNDSLIGSNNKQEIAIPIKGITKSQKRKFSWGKTIGLSAGATLSVATIAVAIVISNLNFGSFGGMQSPP